MSDKKLYKLDDHILFRKCDLYDGCDTQHGDCTNFMDPSKIISKIEVTLKDRKLSQEYDSE